MVISSRTPEGEPNVCPICGKQTCTDPSTTPVKDAPCPHCGHLLFFEPVYAEPAPLPQFSWKSFEGALIRLGQERFGPVPERLLQSVLDVAREGVRSRKLRGWSDLELLVEAADGWGNLLFRLRRVVYSPSRRNWRQALGSFLRRQARRLGRG